MLTGQLVSPQCSSREQAAVLLHSREQAAVLQYTNMSSMRIALLSCDVRWSGFLVVGLPLLGIDARSAVRESRLQPSCIRESRLLSSSIPTCFASALLKYHVVCACVDRRLGSLVVGRSQSLSRSAAWPLSSLLFPGIPHSEVFMGHVAHVAVCESWIGLHCFPWTSQPVP